MLKFQLFAPALFPPAGAAGQSTASRKAIILLMAAACLMAGLDSAQAELKYIVTPVAIGTGEGINNKGDVTGTLSANQHAFLYKKGAITDLGVFKDRFPGDTCTTHGYAVNDSDTVVGFIFDYPGNGTFIKDAFLWTKGTGTITDIAHGSGDGGFGASANAINNRGETVGSYEYNGIPPYYGIAHASLYRNGILTDLGTLGGANSLAEGINNAGSIVGIASNSSTNLLSSFQAFLYTNGRMQAIGGAQSLYFVPWAINDNGWITGTLNSTRTYFLAANEGPVTEPPSGDPNLPGTQTAVLYINGQIRKLGTLSGYLGSEGLSINNSGTVVGNLLGNVVDPSDPGYTYIGVTGAFVYDGKIHNLSNLVEGNWKIVFVGHINDAGQIAATATLPGSTATYAVVLTPKGLGLLP